MPRLLAGIDVTGVSWRISVAAVGSLVRDRQLGNQLIVGRIDVFSLVAVFDPANQNDVDLLELFRAPRQFLLSSRIKSECLKR